MPSNSSLWRTREKQFEKFRASIIVLPVPATVARVDKAQGYSLHIMSVLSWVLPDSTLRSWSLPTSHAGESEDEDDEDDELLVTLGVHVSLFHATSKRFFGNTWVSPEIAVDPFQIKQDRHTKDNTIRHVVENVVLNFRAYFISDVVDPNCVGICELVAYEKDPDSKATISVVGCGWTILPLFTSTQSAHSGGNNKKTPSAFAIGTSGESVNVFVGSPRVLWEIPSTMWHAQEKQDQCKFYYQLVLYEPLLSIAMFLRKNELVGALETIPGLRNGNLANIDMGKNPKMLLREDEDTSFEEALATFVKLASLVPKSILLEEDFTINVFATRVAIHLREEIEANLVARLKISRKTIHEGAVSIDGEVSARVLKLALHNGRCFRTRLHTVPLKVEQQGSDSLRCATNQTKLKGFVLHPHIAIVVILQFTVHFRIAWPPRLKQQAIDAKKPLPPEEDVVLVTMGTRTLVPSDGKKLYLYDKHHHATAEASEPLFMTDALLPSNREDRVSQEERRLLHVELLSGAPCRPYSDNPLYTPPNQGGKPLAKQGLTVKDSIAFVDLRIMIDGEGVTSKKFAPLSPKSPIKSLNPPSPAKSFKDINTNQRHGGSSDENEKVYAAEHWATKMLKKANKNSVLAHTLNALAASSPKKQGQHEKQPDQSNQQHVSPPASPAKKQQISAQPADPAPLLSQALTTELSRASKTLLTRYGFMDAHDTSAANQGSSSPSRNQPSNNSKAAARALHPAVKSLGVELNDIYKAHEIRFHFAAYRAFSTARCTPSRVYFTFQFYTFPPTRTETLRLSKAFDNGTGGEIQTFLLMRESPASKPSLAIQFDVDTTASLDPLETRKFAEYLQRRNLYVDVWDADSLFQLGTFTIPLHELLRQGSGIKKFQAEVDIVQPDLDALVCASGEDDESVHIGDVERSCTSRGGTSTVGKVQFLVSNYGLKGQHSVSQTQASSATLRQTSLPFQRTSIPSDRPIRVKHRVRARPLVDSNAELLRLLSQEGFYGADGGRTRQRRDKDEEKLRRERRKQHERGASDATSLSPKEIAILCDLFGSKKSSANSDHAQDSSHRSTRIKCDREGRTGLLALLSLNPQLPSQQPQTLHPARESKPARSLDAKPVVTKKDSTSALHSDRLRRVLAIVKANPVGLERAFAHLDLDKDGFLSREEFVQALRSMGTVFADLSDEDILAIVSAMDLNNDGKIDYREFGALLSSAMDQGSTKSAEQWTDEIKRILVRAKEKGIPIHKIFAEFDASGDGNLSFDEFGRALEKLGVPEEQERKNRETLMAAFDNDKDGQISYDEFLQSLGISVETNKAEVVKETIQDIEMTVRENFKRLEQQGIDLTHVFVHFDKDQNGTLSVEEFTQALMQLLRPDQGVPDVESAGTSTLKALESESIDAYVKKINANGDDAIDYHEFLTLCGVTGTALKKQTQSFRNKSRVQAEKKLIKLLVRAFQASMTIEQVFAQFDADADGKITLAEFAKALDQLFHSQGLTKDDIAVITSRFDENGDGEISFPEFQHFGREIQTNQHTLTAFFLPHTGKLTDVEKESGKIPLAKWQHLCTKDLKLSKQQMDAIEPLLPYFELLDDSEKVDITQLCALVAQPAVPAPGTSSKSESKKSDGVTRLREFLLKAKSMGVDTEKMFAEFDANGDGEITRDEFKTVLQKLGRFDDIPGNELDAMLRELDGDRSGRISLREFKALLGESGAESDELMKRFANLLDEAAKHGFNSEKCFEHFDKDGGGKITKDEFVNGMAELGLGADNQTLNEIFKKLDRDASGEICFAEFKQLFPGSDAGSTESSMDDGGAQKQHTARSKPVGRPSMQKPPAKPATQPSDPIQPASAPDVHDVPTTTGDRLRTLLQQAVLSGHDVSGCFDHFDGDRDRKITTDEFIQGMKALAGFENVSESELRSLVVELDNDASGSVSLEEFKAFVRSDPVSTVDESALASTRQEETNGVAKSVEENSTAVGVKEPPQHPADYAAGDQPGRDKSVGEKPIEDVSEATGVQEEPMQTASDGAQNAAPSTETKAKPAISKPGTKPPLRSSSFALAKGKPPSLAAARRAETDSESISAAAGDTKAPAVERSDSQPEESNASKKPVRAVPQRAPSFAAARAAKAAAARRTLPPSQESAISLGLEKLRALLLAAQEQGVDIQVSFDHFDEDENGRLTYEEFSRGLKKLGGDFLQLSDEEVAGMAKELDQQQQSEIDVQDLVKLISDPPPTARPVTSNKAGADGNPPDQAPPDAENKSPAVQVSVPKQSGAKAAPVSARGAATGAPSHAPVRRTSSLKPAPKKAASATPNEDSVVVAQAPVRRTSSLQPAAQKAGPGAPTNGAPTVVVSKTGAASSVGTGDLNDKKVAQDAQKSPPALLPETKSVGQVESAAMSNGGDCAYSFHPDPQIRSVELKLRRAAMDAYARGILPLRVISKFLDRDDGRSMQFAGDRNTRHTRKKRDELLRVEFLQVLMELGFSLLSDRQDDEDGMGDGGAGITLGGAPQPVTRMNDYLYARQLERLSRYKHHIKEETKAQKQLVRAVTKSKQQQSQVGKRQQQLAAEDSLRRFADEKNQLLRVLSYYRDGQKKSLVYSLIRDQVTTSITLAPSFGALLFLELPFQNPYNHHERFRMEMVLPSGPETTVLLDVDIVKNGSEWEFYRQNLPLAYASSRDDDATVYPVEKEMIDDHNEVVMDAHDRIQIPLRIRWLDATLKPATRRSAAGTAGTQAASNAVPVSLAIRSCSHGHTVALFKLQLEPQPWTCHRVLRFSHPSGSIWRWQMRCPRGKYLVCMDPSVAVDGDGVDAAGDAGDATASKENIVGFKCRVGEYPSLEEFYVVLYEDKYYAEVYEIWQIRIQAKLRLDIHAVMGQSVKSELIIRGDGGGLTASGRAATGVRRHVKCFTTFDHSHHIQFHPSQVFQLVPHAFNRIAFAFCATDLAGRPEGCRVLVNLVDVETHELVGAWIVHVSISLPLVTKTYELRLPVGQPAQKKISYANPWDQQQTILLRSSEPALLKPREPVVQLPSNGQVFLRLGFAPMAHKAREHMYLFINDKQTDQNEECLLFQVTYE